MHMTRNRVDHHGLGHSVGRRGVVRDCLGSFQAHLQRRGEPRCYRAAAMAARRCGMPCHEQHPEHAATWSKLGAGFTAAHAGTGPRAVHSAGNNGFFFGLLCKGIAAKHSVP